VKAYHRETRVWVAAYLHFRERERERESGVSKEVKRDREIEREGERERERGVSKEVKRVR
jgi:hypothetical protein